MTIDLMAFGYGLGLVIAGWMAGVVVSFAFSLAGGISRTV
jgi:hypothetical protein